MLMMLPLPAIPPGTLGLSGSPLPEQILPFTPGVPSSLAHTQSTRNSLLPEDRVDQGSLIKTETTRLSRQTRDRAKESVQLPLLTAHVPTPTLTTGIHCPPSPATPWLCDHRHELILCVPSEIDQGSERS